MSFGTIATGWAMQQKRKRANLPRRNKANTMTIRPVLRRRATVSASALALHLDCSRAYIEKLEAGRDPTGGGFPLGPEPRCLPAVSAARAAHRAEANAAHVAVKDRDAATAVGVEEA